MRGNIYLRGTLTRFEVPAEKNIHRQVHLYGSWLFDTMKCSFTSFSALALLGFPCVVLAAPTSHSKWFSSVVIFGDSYTDQGVHQYRPDENGEVAEPVCSLFQLSIAAIYTIKKLNLTVLNQGTSLSTGGRVWPQYVGQYSDANI
jgi:hypothetical protein